MPSAAPRFEAGLGNRTLGARLLSSGTALDTGLANLSLTLSKTQFCG